MTKITFVLTTCKNNGQSNLPSLYIQSLRTKSNDGKMDEGVFLARMIMYLIIYVYHTI